MSKTITLLLEAHGIEDLDTAIIAPKIELLSFTGKTGELGDFGIIDNVSLEISILNLLRDLYSSQSQNQESVYNSENLVTSLRLLYKKTEINYKNGGFSRTYPRNQRFFSFEPNPHEDCRKCNNVDKADPIYAKICIPNRNSEIKPCPVYGVVVVASSDIADLQFTLASTAASTNIKLLSLSNLHMNKSAENYWFQKITNDSAQKKFQNMIQNNEVSLTNLSQIFEAMGYTKIYILDPSCRGNDIIHNSKFKSATYSIIEKKPREITSIRHLITEQMERDPQMEQNQVNQSTNLNNLCEMGSKCWENMFGNKKQKINGGKNNKQKKTKKNKKKQKKTKKNKKNKKNKKFKFTKLNKTKKLK